MYISVVDALCTKHRAYRLPDKDYINVISHRRCRICARREAVTWLMIASWPVSRTYVSRGRAVRGWVHVSENPDVASVVHVSIVGGDTIHREFHCPENCTAYLRTALRTTRWYPMKTVPVRSGS
jgi:hypothetical protein